MPKYLIVIKQNGEECDYSIGCGSSYWFFDAIDLEEAKAKAISYLKDDFGPYEDCDHAKYSCFFLDERDRAMSEAFIVEASQMVEVGHFYKEWHSKHRIEHERQLEEDKAVKERELYESLKKKYE